MRLEPRLPTTPQLASCEYRQHQQFSGLHLTIELRMISNYCKFVLIDGGQLQVCFCKKRNCCFLGGGSYGKIFKATATLEREEAVAIKYPDSERQVGYEIATLKSVNHRNILKYYRQFESGIHR